MPTPVNTPDLSAARLLIRIAAEMENVARATEALHDLACGPALDEQRMRAAQGIDLNTQLLRDMGKLVQALAREAPEGWSVDGERLGAVLTLDSLKGRLLGETEDSTAIPVQAGVLELF